MFQSFYIVSNHSSHLIQEMNVINVGDTASIDSKCLTFTSDPLVYRVATKADCDSLVTLINSSYRGELSRQGWTNENKLLFWTKN